MIRFELQSGLNHRIYIRPEDVVWFAKDNSPGGGVVLCHSRGTEIVRESIDQMISKLSGAGLTSAVFTIDSGKGERIALYVLPKHVLAVMVNEKRTVTLRLTRGQYEVMQGLEVVLQQIGEGP